MTVWMCLVLVGLHISAAVLNVPQFVAGGKVDGVEVVHYDSKSSSAEPRQDWLSRTLDPQHWEQETGRFSGAQQAFKANIEIAKQRFNQTGDVHVYQTVYGCEWDDVTEEVTGIYQFGYDGEDFIAFSLEQQTWIPAQQQAVITKHKWDSPAVVAQKMNYLTQVCPHWLRRYLHDGKSSLLRTVAPSVSLLQTSPSSPVSCYATGFYPDRAELFWRKDGEQIHEDVDQGEILPNHDGTFQMKVDLDLSSVRAEDWSSYDCVFQLSGVKDDITTKLDKAEIRTNEEKPSIMIMIFILTAVVSSLVLISVSCCFVYKRRNAKRPPISPAVDPSEQLYRSKEVDLDVLM